MPDGGETTATALLNAISNLSSGFIANMIGAEVIKAMGITKGNYDNLPYAIIIRSVVILVPVVFIPFLVPSGSSAEKVAYNLDELKTANGDASPEEGDSAGDIDNEKVKSIEMTSQPETEGQEEESEHEHKQ